MKIYEAWDELKETLRGASDNYKRYSENMRWLEQTGTNVFDDILEVMEELEYKYE